MLQGPELIVILLVALVVFGPERLPGLARKLGSWVGEARKAVKDMSASLEAEVADVKETATDAAAPVRQLRAAGSGVAAEVESVGKAVKEAAETATSPFRWKGPEPVRGPRPADALDDLSEIERTGGPVTDEPDGPAAEA